MALDHGGLHDPPSTSLETIVIRTASLGFPRIGPHRQLKHALEAYWSRRLDAAGLDRAASDIRRDRWMRQQQHGIAEVASNDFSLYDHVLDTCCMVGAIPERFGHTGGPVDLQTYFRIWHAAIPMLAALEMTKWFDTNYHYLVPELSSETHFVADPTKAVTEFREAFAIGILTRPVLVGPVTFLLLAKGRDGGDPLALLPGLLPAYMAVFQALADAGARWIQIDEPCLVTNLPASAEQAYRAAYSAFTAADPRLLFLLTTYFGPVDHVLPLICSLPVHGVHLDLVRAPDQLDAALSVLPQDWVLSLGVVDGRNVWKTDLDRALTLARRAAAKRPLDRLQVAPSCSLLHVPVDLANEHSLESRIANWLAFGMQKLDELSTIVRCLVSPDSDTTDALMASRAVCADRATSPFAVDAGVRARAAAIISGDLHRRSPFSQRESVQRKRLGLPAFPTTTIGSFPQTAEVRRHRSDFKTGTLNDEGYSTFLRAETTRCVRFQEEIGLDVLVHGEFERNDMVEYFGELLKGYAFTSNGWVQSYGSRCVKPPIIVGDISRPSPMTVEWARFAQSLTIKPMKGMLTGPVTMLQWSFVRDDLPRDQVCRQLALALRDEIVDLEAAGIAIVQIDEPALREGLPLRQRDRPAYLRWAVDCFRLATSGVR